MNDYQSKLWVDLMELTESEAFYYQDYETESRTLRIFNYRMASYMEFMRPSALECRGIMFDVTDPSNPWLASLPQEKFFNLRENPHTMDLDLTDVWEIQEKADGSLISTYMGSDGQVALKSKGSISSTQAIDATEWLKLPENQDFHNALSTLTAWNLTVNLEWCAPHNRIVLPYQESMLVGLNIRCNVDGRYLELQTLQMGSPWVYGVIKDHWRGNTLVPTDPTTLVDFIDHIPNMEGIEGFILKLSSGQCVKVKTHWYLTQHRAKDSINSDRRLFETVVSNSHDDLRSMFHDDAYVQKRIDWMEGIVLNEFNNMVNTVERFCTDNQELERKEFAIKAKAEVKPLWFGLCMNSYLGKPNDYKGFMMSKWKEYGIKDQQKGEV